MTVEKIERRLKKMALERDNCICQNCKGIEKKKLEVHHICPKRKSKKDSIHKIENLITLCKSCHFKAHNFGNYGKWINHFKRIITSKKSRRDLNHYIK